MLMRTESLNASFQKLGITRLIDDRIDLAVEDASRRWRRQREDCRNDRNHQVDGETSSRPGDAQDAAQIVSRTGQDGEQARDPSHKVVGLLDQSIASSPPFANRFRPARS